MSPFSVFKPPLPVCQLNMEVANRSPTPCTGYIGWIGTILGFVYLLIAPAAAKDEISSESEGKDEEKDEGKEESNAEKVTITPAADETKKSIKSLDDGMLDTLLLTKYCRCSLLLQFLMNQ